MPPIDKAKVIVVDDDEKSCKILATYLRKDGYEVDTANDGDEALTLVAKAPPDAILLDVLMPGLDGIEVCRQIKSQESTAHLPVLLITGLTEREDRLRGIEAGASDYLTKPLDRQEVLLRVRNAVKTKLLRDDIQKGYDKLKELEELRDGLVHMIVHDMRVPMTVVDGSLQFLLKRTSFPSDTPEHRMLSNALRSTRSMIDIINSLLDVSKLQSGTLPIHRTDFDVVSTVYEAVDALHRPERDAPIEVEAPDGPVLINCDPSIISRVIHNLLVNALRYTPQTKKIRITFEECDEMIKLSVIDEGPGIPPEHQKRIFEKFGQIMTRRNDKMRSTGLGLTFCKLAIEAHAGEVGVISEVGSGSTFWFTVPR